jgi:MYXO-CTERM domain-containing protein
MTFTSKRGRVLLAAAGIFLLPTAGLSQDVAANTVTVGNVVEADPMATEPVRQEEDRDFPWGLLGLLGLAGLLGRKRRDDDRDIRVDARRDTRT